jgi:copper oxidase (laccase) domain-containing protein
MIIIPEIFDTQKIIASQSTRLGGISSPPFDSMNLGLSVKDDEKNVLRNRELFFEKLGIEMSRVSRSHQVHGNKVLLVNEPITTEGYDALITDKPSVYLAVSIAD